MVEKYLGVSVNVPEDILVSARAEVSLIKDVKQLFTRIEPETIRDGDVVLHANHVAVWVDNAAGRGWLHAVDPFSEFWSVDDRRDARTGLNGLSAMRYKDPTFWRLNK